MTIMQNIEAGAGEVAGWITAKLPEAEAIVGQAPTLYAIIAAGVAEVEGSDDPATKALDVIEDLGKAVGVISAAMQANAVPQTPQQGGGTGATGAAQ